IDLLLFLDFASAFAIPARRRCPLNICCANWPLAGRLAASDRNLPAGAARHHRVRSSDCAPCAIGYLFSGNQSPVRSRRGRGLLACDETTRHWCCLLFVWREKERPKATRIVPTPKRTAA